MITLLFLIMIFGFVGKVISLSLHAAWGITKFVLCVIVAPLVLIALFFAGAAALAFPLLILAGILAFGKRVAG